MTSTRIGCAPFGTTLFPAIGIPLVSDLQLFENTMHLDVTEIANWMIRRQGWGVPGQPGRNLSGEKTLRNASDVARAAARSCSTTRGNLPTIPAARRLGPPRRRDAGSRPATLGSCRDCRDRRR